MLKRGTITSVFLVCICMAVAVCTKASMHDSGAVSVRSIEDIQKVPFQFYGIFDDDWMEREEEFYELAEEADLILVVRPTGQIQLHSYAVLQEVEVTHIVDAKENVSDKIWIESNCGFDYQPNKRMDTLFNFGISNILYPEWEYLVFLRQYSWAPGFYYNKFYTGGLRLTCQVDDMTLDDEKIYTYGELAECEFFADSAETLGWLYGIKEDLLNTYYPEGADR